MCSPGVAYTRSPPAPPHPLQHYALAILYYRKILCRSNVFSKVIWPHPFPLSPICPKNFQPPPVHLLLHLSFHYLIQNSPLLFHSFSTHSFPFVFPIQSLPHDSWSVWLLLREQIKQRSARKRKAYRRYFMLILAFLFTTCSVSSFSSLPPSLTIIRHICSILCIRLHDFFYTVPS